MAQNKIWILQSTITSHDGKDTLDLRYPSASPHFLRDVHVPGTWPFAVHRCPLPAKESLKGHSYKIKFQMPVAT